MFVQHAQLSHQTVQMIRFESRFVGTCRDRHWFSVGGVQQCVPEILKA